MDKIIKRKGNYVLVNHNKRLIINAFTEDMISDSLTIYPQPGDELITGTLEEVTKLYPDYELDENLKRKEKDKQTKR